MFLISSNSYMGFRTHLSRTHDTFMDYLSVTPKRGLDKRGLGNQSFLQKSLKNMEKQQKTVEKSYNIYAKTTTQGGGAKRRPLGAPPKAAPVAFGIYFV